MSRIKFEAPVDSDTIEQSLLYGREMCEPRVVAGCSIIRAVTGEGRMRRKHDVGTERALARLTHEDFYLRIRRYDKPEAAGLAAQSINILFHIAPPSRLPRARLGGFVANSREQSWLRSSGRRLSDCRRAATAFRNIAEQGETGSDAAIVWADSD